MKTNEHPLALAREIARMLESDPIAAGQVREHLSGARLVDLLGITPEPLEIDEALKPYDADDICNYVVENIDKGTMLKCYGTESVTMALDGFGDREILEYVAANYTRAQVLEALNVAA